MFLRHYIYDLLKYKFFKEVDAVKIMFTFPLNIGNICFLEFFICDACQHYLYFVFVYPNMLTMQHVIIVDAVYIMFTFPLWEPLKGNACIIILYIQLAYIYHSNICWISSFSNTCVICTCRIIFVDFCECVSHQIS